MEYFCCLCEQFVDIGKHERPGHGKIGLKWVPVNLIDWDSDFFPALSLGLFFDPSTAIF